MLLLPLLLGLPTGSTTDLPGPIGDTPDIETIAAKATAILTSRCASCHGPEGDGGLDVTSRAGLLAGGDLGPSLIPGDPEASTLIGAIRHTHDSLRMPQRRPRLPDAEIEAIVRWVSGGAPWPTAGRIDEAGVAPGAVVTAADRAFWSFLPLSSPAVPEVEDGDWPLVELDHFVLARLEGEGLAPVGPADRRALVRRLSFDLTGLPPTLQETQRFIDDDDPHAYSLLVDRLLASPAYGEHWARWWLDIARYADDDRRSLDPLGRGLADYPNAHLYRDWVVSALNADRSYDQFVRAQLAADALEGYERARDLPALGFLGLGPWQYENASLEVTRAEERDERVDAVSRGLLGLTVSCARCHDHKLEAITSDDYHALAGVFLNTEYHEYPLASEKAVVDYDHAKERIDGLKEMLREMRREARSLLARSLAVDVERHVVAAWRVLGAPQEEPHRVSREEKLDRELFDRYLTFLGQSRERYSFLDEWQGLIADGGTRRSARAIARGFQQLVLDVMLEKRATDRENEIIRAKAQVGTKPRKRANLPNEFLTSDDICPGCDLEVAALDAERSALWTDLFAYDLTHPFDPSDTMGAWRSGLFAYHGADLERRLTGGTREAIERLRARIKVFEKALPAAYSFTHGVADVADPKDLRAHERGDPYRLGDPVPRRFLAVLSPDVPEAWATGSGRRELADAIVEHPLSDRVVVNRAWQALFGRGLVASASNLGQSGDAPSHPELLDYVAYRFRESGRSLKSLHRMLVVSATYRLSREDDAACLAVDPDNRLLWHASRRRLSAEQLRDAVLSVSGVLDRSMGGPSKKLAATTTRRTLYAHVSRLALHEYLRLFDFPSPSVTSPGRFTTDVPAQRLFLSNSEFVARNAERLVERVLDVQDEVARIERLYELLYGRKPVAAEIEAALEYVAAEPLARFREQAEEPREPADEPADGGADEPADEPADADADGDADSPDNDPVVQRTAWGRLAAALLGSDEFLHID